MDTHHHQHEPPLQWYRWSSLQRVLFILFALFLVAVTVLSFIFVRVMYNPNGSEHHPTPPIALVSPTPSPTSTPTPLPSPSPTLTPSPTPSPLLPVLGYPLYSGNSRLPEIALTFDDGPGSSYTAQILAILGHYHVHATFFVIGSQAATYTDLISQESKQGNSVGNHTWTHPDLTKLSSDQVYAEVQRTSEVIQADAGTPTLFRPPYGHFNRQVQAIGASLGLSMILWNVDPRDWSRPGVNAIIQRVLDTTQNGAIILMYDGGGDRSQTVAALPTIITTLEQRGFQFVTIQQMIKHLPSGGTAMAHISPDQFSPESVTTPGSRVVP